METHIVENNVIGAKITADIIQNTIENANKEGRKCILGLATGSSPIPVYRELVERYKAGSLSFKEVITFNLDEYYPIEPQNTQSYWYFMHKHLFDHIDILPENINIPSGSIAQQDIAGYCEQYERKIASVGGLDFQLLGIGRSGHIGFNEPGSDDRTKTRMVTLHEQTIIDAANDFGGRELVPKNALTMGVSTILAAKKIVMLAWGIKKASVIDQMMNHSISAECPASYLRNISEKVVLIIDKDASSRLQT